MKAARAARTTSRKIAAATLNPRTRLVCLRRSGHIADVSLHREADDLVVARYFERHDHEAGASGHRLRAVSERTSCHGLGQQRAATAGGRRLSSIESVVPATG